MAKLEFDKSDLVLPVPAEDQRQDDPLFLSGRDLC